MAYGSRAAQRYVRLGQSLDTRRAIGVFVRTMNGCNMFVCMVICITCASGSLTISALIMMYIYVLCMYVICTYVWVGVRACVCVRSCDTMYVRAMYEV